jgi:hypothetical protein
MTKTVNTTPNAPALSLLTTYREREEHLKVLLAWLERIRESENFTDFELVLVEGAAEPTAAALASGRDWVKYVHVPMPGVFHKQLLLNRAASLTRGEYRIPFDVDLLPADGVLAQHLRMAREMPRCLVAGYRVQLKETPGEGSPLPTTEELLKGMDVKDQTLICEEDFHSSLLEYLLEKQRFGVCPCIPAGLFDELGGVDEQYVGWGGDDQDLIERVCASGLLLIRSYDLLYFHLPHGYGAGGWASPEQVAANRQRFRQQRKARTSA